ncbi:MAG: helix-turn-helix domain-containing protein [Clostridia bacterium]|nr:helix-turn-helix domain-containing protein [Clostridia bacterium]MBR1710051.1 helix-turn-helix domain-containing protein [Clostridia bacterium]
MTNQFMRAEEVAKELGISKSFAYKLIRQLNQELREKGFLTISGRVNRDYFQERLYKSQRGVTEHVSL